MRRFARVTRLLRSIRTTTSSSSASSPEAAPTLLQVGAAVRERRRFSEADVSSYAEVSGDRNPVHLDPAFAREVAGFERGPVVHGMLVASLFPSIIASHFPGAVYATQTLKFALPVYIGDEVLAEVRATNIKESNRKYIVRFATKCFTTEDSLLIDGEAMTILPTLELKK